MQNIIENIKSSTYEVPSDTHFHVSVLDSAARVAHQLPPLDVNEYDFPHAILLNPTHFEQLIESASRQFLLMFKNGGKPVKDRNPELTGPVGFFKNCAVICNGPLSNEVWDEIDRVEENV